MTIFVSGTLSPDDSQFLVMGTKVSLLAQKELLENAKFDFRSVEGASECPECHVDQTMLD